MNLDAFAQLFVVWTPDTVIVAVFAGLLVGYAIVGAVASDPEYAAATATARDLGRIVTYLVVIVGLVFYVGQAVASWADNDPNWTRVVGRFGLWIVYGVMLGLGTWRRVIDSGRRRQKRALEQAHREIDA